MNEFFLKFSAPFIKSTKEAFRVMIGTELTMHSPKFKNHNQGRGDITAFIGLTGKIKSGDGDRQFRGLLALSFSEKVYLKIVSKMLGEEIVEYSNEIADAGSELANIILGTAKPGLQEIGIQLGMTSPSSVRGHMHEINYPKDGAVVETVVSCELGDFYMDLCCQDFPEDG